MAPAVAYVPATPGVKGCPRQKQKISKFGNGGRKIDIERRGRERKGRSGGRNGRDGKKGRVEKEAEGRGQEGIGQDGTGRKGRGEPGG